METIVPSVVAGLTVRAIGGAAGSLARLFGHRRQKVIQDALDDLDPSAKSYILPALARLAEHGPAAQDSASKFLQSLEAETYLRSVACGVMAGRLQEVRSDLVDQLIALLILAADAPRESAPDIANELFLVFVQALEGAVEKLRRSDKSRGHYEEMRRRALAEYRSGALDGLVQRNRLLVRRDAGDLARYLEFADQYRALLSDRTSELVPAYFDIQRRVPINQLYVMPKFNLYESDSYSRSLRPEPVPLVQLLERSYRTVVLGDPGAGKSTLVQYLAHTYSKSACRGSEAGAIPLIVSLRSYDEWLAATRGVSVVDFLEGSIRETYQLNVPEGAIEYLLVSGRAFVLFDGLDELLSVARRRNICETIANFSDLYATATVIVTSRKIGYFEAPINPRVFTTAELMEFDEVDVGAYAMGWFAADGRLSLGDRRRITASFLLESESASDIRRNPLMLGLMCNLYRGSHTIPQNRADLYEKCAEMLFEQWDAGRGLVTPGVLRADAKAALQDVALWMYVTPRLSGGVSERELVRRLASFWSGRVEGSAEALDKAKELLSLWRGRTWILSDVGSTATNPRLIYKFTHRTFLEYFAAVEIVRTNPTPELLCSALIEPIAMETWEIVAQVAIQKLDELHADGGDKVTNLLIMDAIGRYAADQSRILSFIARNVTSLHLRPATIRRLVNGVTDLTFLTMATVSPIGTSDEYSRSCQLQLRREDTGRRGSRLNFSEFDLRDAWKPMIELLATTGGLHDLVVDQIACHSAELIRTGGPSVASKAFVLMSSRLYVQELARVLASPIQHDLVVRLRADQWDIVTLCRKLGSVITKSMIREWGECNFWAPVMACRDRQISVAEMVEISGPGTVLCSADPFVYLGTFGADQRSIAEYLLLIYIGLARGAERRYRLAEVRAGLAAVGRAVDEHMPVFDEAWMPETSLRERVVDRRFLTTSDDVAASGKTRLGTSADASPYVLAGGAILLAAIIEAERWSLSDYSSDQLGRLNLGPLQVLEPLYVTRRTPMIWSMDVDEAFDRVELPEGVRKTLRSWSLKRLDLLADH